VHGQLALGQYLAAMEMLVEETNRLHLEATHLSPRIYFDLPKGIIKITGRAVDTPMDEKFDVLISWIELYCRVPNKTTRVDIELDVFTDYSTRYITQILWLLTQLDEQRRTRLTIFWFIDSASKPQMKQIEEIEEKVGFKIYKLSPLLT
jgi:hypothetical protein